MTYLLIFLSLLLQSVFLSVPIIVPVALTSFVVYKNPQIFPIAFIAGIILDLLLLNPLGMTSLFLSALLFSASLYSRKFEIDTIHFVGLFSFVGSIVYLLLTNSSTVFLKGLACAVLGIIVYLVLSHLNKSGRKNLSSSMVK